MDNEKVNYDDDRDQGRASRRIKTGVRVIGICEAVPLAVIMFFVGGILSPDVIGRLFTAVGL
jgi:hypothetical protein